MWPELSKHPGDNVASDGNVVRASSEIQTSFVYPNPAPAASRICLNAPRTFDSTSPITLLTPCVCTRFSDGNANFGGLTVTTICVSPDWDFR